MLHKFSTSAYCVIAALLILHNTLVDYFGVGFTHVPGVVSAVLLILVFLSLPRISLNGNEVVAIFVFLILSTLLSVVFSIDFGVAFFDWIDYLKAFLLAFLMALSVRRLKDLKIIADTALVALVLANLYAVFYFKSELVIYDYGEELVRQSSVRGDPNDSAMVTLAGLPAAIYYCVSSRNMRTRLFGILATAVLIAGVVATSSRGGFLGAVAVFVLLGFFTRNKGTVLLLAATVMILGLTMVSSEYIDRINTLFTFSESGGSSSLYDRADLASQAINVFFNNPVLGVGPNNFRLASGGTHVPHNAYLQVLTDFGALGFLVLALVIFFAARGLIRSDIDFAESGYYMSLLVGIAGMLVTMFFLSQAKSSVFWLYLGFGLTSYRLSHEGSR